jgi:hypothetical protein
MHAMSPELWLTCDAATRDATIEALAERAQVRASSAANEFEIEVDVIEKTVNSAVVELQQHNSSLSEWFNTSTVRCALRCSCLSNHELCRHTAKWTVWCASVRAFRQKFALEDAIELHAFALLEALLCGLTNGIPLGWPLPLTVATVKLRPNIEGSVALEPCYPEPATNRNIHHTTPKPCHSPVGTIAATLRSWADRVPRCTSLPQQSDRSGSSGGNEQCKV